MKRILVLGAGHYQAVLIRYLRENNYYVISLDNITTNPGHAFSHKTYNISTLDKEKVLEVARLEEIDGVITHASDIALNTIGFVNDSIGLAGITEKQANILTQKHLFRKFQLESGLRTPEFSVFDNENSAMKFIQDNPSRSFIVKPVDRSGSLGVTKIGQGHLTSLESLQVLFQNTLGASLSGKIIVEEIIDGEEFSAEGFIIDGEIKIFVTEKILSSPPLMIPIGHIVPNLRSDEIVRELKSQILKLFEILKISRGVFDLDGKIDANGRVTIIEVTSRTGGNCIPDLINEVYGINLLEISSYLCLGLLPPKESLVASNSGCFSGVGIISSKVSGKVKGFDESFQHSFRTRFLTCHIVLDLKENDSVKIFSCGADRLGHYQISEKDYNKIKDTIQTIDSTNFYHLDFKSC